MLGIVIANNNYKFKEKQWFLRSIEIKVIKVRKQGWSPTSSDILVGI